jgi:hypothetical protein
MDPSIANNTEALVMERKQWETEFLTIEVQVTNHHEEEGETELLPIGEVIQVNQEKEGDETGFLPVGNHKEETHIVNLADFIHLRAPICRIKIYPKSLLSERGLCFYVYI